MTVNLKSVLNRFLATLAVVVALPLAADDTSTGASVQALIMTSMGEIRVDLDAERAPLTVENFIRYAEDGFYDGTIFHRVIANFMIQGGGFTADMAKKPVGDPIRNEADNGLSNVRGTIAMARLPAPDTATSQFFINVRNNQRLDYSGPENPGYAVFGTVTEGMDVVDAIKTVRTGVRNGRRDVPLEPVVIESVTIIRD